MSLLSFPITYMLHIFILFLNRYICSTFKKIIWQKAFCLIWNFFFTVLIYNTPLEHDCLNLGLSISSFLSSRLNKLKMFIPSKEDVLILVQKHYETFILAVLSIGVTFLVCKLGWKTVAIRGRLGLPFIGETFSFLSATNSTKGCYEFVRLRRQWLVFLLHKYMKYLRTY